MSITMDQAADTILQAAREASLDDLSDMDVDPDGSSSLSEIEDKDGDQDDDGEGSDELSNISGEENDSEAETERLEDSPHKFRQQKDVVLSSNAKNQVYEHSPSKLHKQITLDDDEEEEEEMLSEDDISEDGSPKSSAHDERDPEPVTTSTSLEDSSREDNNMLSVMEVDTRKRKRSIMAVNGLDEDNDEPLRKRTGSIMAPAEDYAIEDDPDDDVNGETSNPISGNISDEEGEAHKEDTHEAEESVAIEERIQGSIDTPASPRKRGRKKKKTLENGVNSHNDDAERGNPALNGDDEARNGDEHEAENEGDDEAELISKNEEELERKKIALEQLSAIESQFTTFRERLYDERLEQLNREEAMLRQANPTHPEYLAMMQCIDARRDEKIRIADTIREFQMGSLKNFAVARRSQILVQYQQEVREIREKKLEQLGKQWYEIQHDRRSYAGSVPDYTLKFPTRRSQQVQNQVAYSKEVSILSGVAKYVGFPAAPPMAPTTAEELEDDLEKMGRTKQVSHPIPAFPMQELAALRSVGSTSRFKPAEEQFIEQTPWANPQHPSHAHLIQRQTSTHQAPRTTSPFSQVQVQPIRRHSPHGVPISGTFTSSSSFHTSNGVSVSGGRISPHNPFTNSTHSHTIAPSPLGSRQTSLSPQQNRHPPIPDQPHNISNAHDIPKSNGTQHSPSLAEARDFPHEGRREQAAAIMGRF